MSKNTKKKQAQIPDSEVKSKKPRKRYTVKYKLEILKKVDECKKGEIGALLRREGLYYLTLSRWRKQYKEGKLEGLKGKKEGRKKKQINPLEKKVKQLEKENKKLEKKLNHAEKIIDFQKKIAELMEIEE